jgi:hypothetical protein
MKVIKLTGEDEKRIERLDPQGSTEHLKWTYRMQAVHDMVVHSPHNREELPATVHLVAEHDWHVFFLYLPALDDPSSSWVAVRRGDHVIQSKLPPGYELIAWYGWGGNGWLAEAQRA